MGVAQNTRGAVMVHDALNLFYNMKRGSRWL